MTTTLPLHIIANEEHYCNALSEIERNSGRTIDSITLTRGDKCAVLKIRFL